MYQLFIVVVMQSKQHFVVVVMQSKHFAVVVTQSQQQFKSHCCVSTCDGYTTPPTPETEPGRLA